MNQIKVPTYNSVQIPSLHIRRSFLDDGKTDVMALSMGGDIDHEVIICEACPKSVNELTESGTGISITVCRIVD